MDGAPSQAASSKRAKILKRTRVGASIAAGLALVLWGAIALDSPLPVLAVSLAVLGVCIWEVARMGSLRGRGYGWVLGAAGVVVAYALSTHPAFLEPGGERRWAVDEFCRGAVIELAWGASITALCAFAFVRVRSLFVRAAAVAALALNLFVATDSRTLDFAALVLLLFLGVRLALLGGAELRRETIAVVLLATLLVVSIPSLAVAWLAFGHMPFIALLAIAKLGDTAGYYVGSTIGRHKPFKVSPNKTIEGCLGSLAASALVGVGAVALGWLPSEQQGFLGGALAGAIVNVAAQTSDLLESWVKRIAGVKDSGTWFSTSGGMLDLVDSFFLAVPAALLWWPLIFDFPRLAFGEVHSIGPCY